MDSPVCEREQELVGPVADRGEQVKVLQKIDNHVDERRLCLLRLFFCLLAGVYDGDVEKARYLCDFLDVLEQVFSSNVVHVLQYVLQLIGIHESSVLGASEDEMKSLEESKELAYPSLIVSVCLDLQTADFDRLKSNLCCPTVLNCSAAKFTSCDALFLELHHREKISCENLECLARELHGIGREDIARRVRHFIQSGKFKRLMESPASKQLSLFQEPVQETSLGVGDSETVGPQSSQGQKDSSLTSPSSVDKLADDLTADNANRSGNAGGLEQPQTTHDSSIPESFPSSEGISGQPRSHVLSEVGYPQPRMEVNAPPPTSETGHQFSHQDSNDPLLPEAKKLLRAKLKKLKTHGIRLIATFVVCLILAFLLIGVTAWWLSYGLIYTASKGSVYAEGGETIVVAEITDIVALTWNSISECHVTPGDFPHSNQLYIVPADMLQRRSRFDHIDFTYLFNQTETDCTNNILPDPFYGLDGTSVEIEICVTSDTEPTSDGTLLIFNDNQAFEEFTSNGDCEPTNTAASRHNLNIGSYGTFECTSIHYMAHRSSHLYAVPVIPGKVWYKYRYNYTQFYLDRNDFGNLKCMFSSAGNNNCPIGFISHPPTYLIVYIEPVAEDNSKSTHLCLQSDWSRGLIVYVVVFGFSAAVFLLITCILLICLCCIFHKQRTTKKRLRGLLTSSAT